MGRILLGVSLLLLALGTASASSAVLSTATQIASQAVPLIDGAHAHALTCTPDWASQVTSGTQLSPLSNGVAQPVDGSGYSCAFLLFTPAFGFTGTVTATLTDSVGNHVQASIACTLTGGNFLPGVPAGCTMPPPDGQGGLVAGPMTLTGSAGPGLLPVPLGQWQVGVVFGN
jgi:hypothetical protein